MKREREREKTKVIFRHFIVLIYDSVIYSVTKITSKLLQNLAILAKLKFFNQNIKHCQNNII